MTTSGEPIPLLEMREITKRYGGVLALAGVTAAVLPGQVVGLVGGNGAGKSTLVKILSGVQSQDAGTLLWDGAPVSFRSPADARSVGIDTVYQDLALAGDLNAVANLFLNRELSRGVGPFRIRRDAAMRGQAVEIFERFGIDVPLDLEVRSMSGGQQQGVAIGRALLGGSRLLVLDEPTAALGVKESRQVEQLMQSLRDSGVAIILVSHNVDQLLDVCDVLLVLRRGHMVGLFDRQDLTAHDVVSLIIGADELETSV